MPNLKIDGHYKPVAVMQAAWHAVRNAMVKTQFEQLSD